MPGDTAMLAAIALLAIVLAWPALVAWQRRRQSAEASAVAAALAAFADELRRENACRPPDPALLHRVDRLRLPELGAFHLAPNLPNTSPELVADAAMRLALRLKRRVAFERKMLARTAAGRRRGAVAGSLPPVVLLALALAGVELPPGALVFVSCAEGLGCWLLARFATVAP
jgi:hypothetical protein